MLAAPVAANKPTDSGPRPINLGKDVRPVLALLNTSFGPLRDSRGRAISDRFSLNQSAPFARRLSMMSRGFIMIMMCGWRSWPPMNLFRSIGIM